jgi:hypothetical protein
VEPFGYAVDPKSSIVMPAHHSSRFATGAGAKSVVANVIVAVSAINEKKIHLPEEGREIKTCRVTEEAVNSAGLRLAFKNHSCGFGVALDMLTVYEGDF